jgi:hypothetical protein
MVDFVQDDEKLREERKKAKTNKNKYVGMSGLQASSHYGNILKSCIWNLDFLERMIIFNGAANAVEEILTCLMPSLYNQICRL